MPISRNELVQKKIPKAAGIWSTRTLIIGHQRSLHLHVPFCFCLQYREVRDANMQKLVPNIYEVHEYSI